ncbi:D-glycero-alpha-D-manno-heptose-7-phosphate kinase [Prosthecobacter fusiformis]|uniref:D-glycero-alpha-D-manno-heptose-7-phosphate kinase n=1 Tax=Prosthecobacter fusiformis TaxID=48464 RepID=A0A4R7S314_9BACT|nr:dehydrogenase [Prosthecobacter fusiformis]TDU71417.1 D-glycero-alpha-D-manno-heptose-7-phosphate kinase [Prosthecobacter fusiformis]
MTKYRARAPLRLGLAGGGTDVSPYCDLYGGQVLNATINHYAHCTIEPLNTAAIEFHALDIDQVEYHTACSHLKVPEGLSLHRETYNLIVERFNDGKPLHLRMSTSADAPPGSGLGSSSTLVVAMIQAYSEWLRLPLGEYDIARTAFEVERVRLKQTGGRQDQYAAAFGGVNYIEFRPEEHVVVNPLRIKSWIMNELETSLVLYYSSVPRESSRIIEEQVKMVEQGESEAINATHRLKEDAIRMKDALLRGDFEKIGQILNRSWEAKKMLASSISNSSLDETIAEARRAGAIAAKVSGAGGGGFMMFLVEPSLRHRLERALLERRGRLLPFRFCVDGVESWTVK